MASGLVFRFDTCTPPMVAALLQAGENGVRLPRKRKGPPHCDTSWLRSPICMPPSGEMPANQGLGVPTGRPHLTGPCRGRWNVIEVQIAGGGVRGFGGSGGHGNAVQWRRFGGRRGGGGGGGRIGVGLGRCPDSRRPRRSGPHPRRPPRRWRHPHPVHHRAPGRRPFPLQRRLRLSVPPAGRAAARP